MIDLDRARLLTVDAEVGNHAERQQMIHRLVGEVEKLRATIAKARDLIGDEGSDNTLAALDAWALLDTAVPGGVRA